MRFTTTTSILSLAIASQCFGTGGMGGRVIITEIMYNPASSENKSETEWVEIANVGTESIEMKDWRLDDEDKPSWGKFSCTLEPGEVAVLINSAAVTEEQFRAAWDEMAGSAGAESSLKYQVIAVKWAGISNKPTADNEVLQLRNEKDEVVCEVKQEGQWPSCEKPDGPSVALTDIAATGFNDGKLWVRSQDGEHGARLCRKTEIFGGKDIGSPGFVPGLSGAKVVSKPDATVPKEEARPDVKDSNTIDY